MDFFAGFLACYLMTGVFVVIATIAATPKVMRPNALEVVRIGVVAIHVWPYVVWSFMRDDAK